MKYSASHVLLKRASPHCQAFGPQRCGVILRLRTNVSSWIVL